MLSRRAQLARLRQVAVAALERFPLAGRSAHVRCPRREHHLPARRSRGRHLVRVHRPQRHGRDVDTRQPSARRSPGYRRSGRTPIWRVPVAVAARDGASTVEATAAGETRICSVLRWMDGRIHEESARPVHLLRLGDAMARLHDQADAWTPPPDFVRIRWDHETFFGDVMVYGETPAAGCWTLLPERCMPASRGGRAAGRRHAASRWRTGSSTPTCTSATRCSRAGMSSSSTSTTAAPVPGSTSSPSPCGSCGTDRTTRRTETRCWPATDRAGRSTSRTWTTSSRCGRSRSTSGTPARPRSTRPSPRGSTESTAGPWRCSTSWRLSGGGSPPLVTDRGGDLGAPAAASRGR